MNIFERLKKIKTICLDVDGVLTDSSLLLGPDAKLWRTMHARDGFAMFAALKKGYRLAIITGGRNDMVENRLKALGIEDVFLASYDKVKVLEDYVCNNNINLDELLFMGDDLNDFKVVQKAACIACPADACHEVKSIAHYISGKKGGNGCVRDVIEKIMRLNDDWPDGSLGY